MGKSIWLVGCLWLGVVCGLVAQPHKPDRPKKQKNGDNQPIQIQLADDAQETELGLQPLPNSQEAEYYFLEGMKYYLIDDLGSAMNYFKKALQFAPDNAGIYYKMAETAYYLGNSNEAILYAGKSLSLNKANKFSYILLAKMYEEQLNFNEAAKIYQDLLNNLPNAYPYYFELAALYQYQKKWQDALAAFEQLEKITGFSEEISLQRVQIYVQMNDLKKAMAETEVLLAQNPDDLTPAVNLLQQMAEQNRIGEVMPLLERVKQINPNDPRVALLISGTYRSEGKTDKALAELQNTLLQPSLSAEQKIKLLVSYMQQSDARNFVPQFAEMAASILQQYPTDGKANAVYADILSVQGKQKEALQYYLLAAAGDVNTLELWSQILRLDSELNLMDSLAKHAEMALEVFPNYAAFWLYQGIGFSGIKKYEAAIEALESGKRIASRQADLVYEFNIRLGDAHHALQNYIASDAAFEDALATKPDDFYVLNNYSYYLALRKEKLDKAEEMAAKLIKSQPNNANFLDTYAWVKYQLGKYGEAKSYLEKALQLSSSATILEHYGDVLFKLGEPGKALENWEKAKQMGGDSEKLQKKINDKNLYE